MRAATKRAVFALLIVFSCAPHGSSQQKSKPPSPCRAYFTVIEADEVTVGLPMVGLNRPQLSWYQKHGNDGKLAGICYWDVTGHGSQISLAAFLDDEKASRIQLPDGPIYAIAWGESLVREPYTYQTTQQNQITVTDENGNTSTGTVNTPVTHSGTKQYYVASGTLQHWDLSSQKFIPLSPLHNHNHTIFTSASTSLLKDGLEAIRKEIEQYK